MGTVLGCSARADCAVECGTRTNGTRQGYALRFERALAKKLKQEKKGKEKLQEQRSNRPKRTVRNKKPKQKGWARTSVEWGLALITVYTAAKKAGVIGRRRLPVMERLL